MPAIIPGNVPPTVSYPPPRLRVVLEDGTELIGTPDSQPDDPRTYPANRANLHRLAELANEDHGAWLVIRCLDGAVVALPCRRVLYVALEGAEVPEADTLTRRLPADHLPAVDD